MNRRKLTVCVTTSDLTLLPRIDVEQRRDDNQHQGFHEDEKARDESSIFKVSVLVSDKRSQHYPRGQPDKLSFSIPHRLIRTGQPVAPSRKKVMTESALLTGIAWAVAIVATFWFDTGGPFENLAKVAALLFFLLGLIGLVRFLYGFLFVKDLVDKPVYNACTNAASQGALGDPPRRAALPSQRDVPATDYQQRSNTKEMAPQPSVTENTTRLLQDPPVDRNE